MLFNTGRFLRRQYPTGISAEILCAITDGVVHLRRRLADNGPPEPGVVLLQGSQLVRTTLTGTEMRGNVGVEPGIQLVIKVHA
jgi:hypothetical protein